MKLVGIMIVILFALVFTACDNVRNTDEMDNPMEAEALEDTPVYKLDNVDTITFRIDESSETIETEIEDVQDELDLMFQEDEFDNQSN